MADKRPNTRGPSRGDGSQRREPGPPGEDTSFGSFVSDSVRRSAGRFHETGGEGRPTRRRASEAERETQRFGVPRRRERVEPVSPSSQPEDREGATERPAWMQEAIDRAGSPERALAALAILIVGIIALIWLLVAVLGGDDDGGGDPTATEVLQVLPIGDQGTPGTETPITGPGTGIVTPTPSVPMTPTVGGSDNMLDQVPSTPAAGAPPGVACDEACLARVERTPEAEGILATSGTRPSYTGDEWFWVVAEPDDIAAISSQLDTKVVRESTDTLGLYMVTLPAPGEGDWAAWEIGEVIDSAGRYRLVDAAKVPANVRPATDAGLSVEKVAPASADVVRPESRPELREADIGGMSDDVDSARLEQTVLDLQSAGSGDANKNGTRYYTTTGNQLAAEYLFRQLESYGLNVWYEDFVSWDGLLLVNVVGEIPGRDTSRLYGVMAHFDTISESPTQLAPGADDNASGVAATLEIARILVDYDLKFPLRVVFVNYEEGGVVGSQEFATDAVEAGDPWQGIFNIDSVGSPRNGNQIILNTDGGSAWMSDLIRRVNDAYGLNQKLEIMQSAEIVADDNRLRDRGLEAVMIARELYGWSPVHHTEKDVADQVSIPHVQSTATLILMTVASLMV